MLGAALVLLGLACLVASATLFTSCLRFESAAPFLLTTYLIGWAELMLACLALSLVDALSRTGLTLAFPMWAGLALLVWRRRGRPRPPDFANRVRWLRRTLRRSELGLLWIALSAGYTYLIVLAWYTPQNDGDPLVYQLTRAAFWRQDGHIGVLHAATEPRLDVNPILAETGDAVWLILAGSERYVWLGQFTAVGALAVGAFALARRVGLDARSALLGGTIIPALPLIAMQAGTAYNDLVLASFVVAAAVFVLGRTRTDLLALALSIALAVATKFTAPFVLPLVAMLGVLAQPARRWFALLSAFVAGTLLGGGWYVVNLVRTGQLDGGLASFGHQEPIRTLPGIVQGLDKLVLDTVELPGGSGRGAALIIVLGLALAIAGSAPGMRRRFRSDVLVAGLVLAAAPLVVEAASRLLAALFAETWEIRGRTEVAEEFWGWRPSTVADGAASWYGPLAAFVGIAVFVACWVRVRRGSLGRAAIGLALAPWLGIVLLAVSVSYDPWRGRFLASAWVMGIAMWGVLASRRALALSVVVVTTVIFGLSVVSYLGKPLGVDALSDGTSRSIWRLERWDAQTVLRYGTDRLAGERSLLREVHRRVPNGDAIAVSVASNDLLFPYFGSDLSRHVALVAPRERVPPSAAWFVAAPGAALVGCADAWRLVASFEPGWRLYRRTGEDGCATPQSVSVQDSSA